MSRIKYPMPIIEREVAIYLAGLIDGEATFFVAKSKKHKTSLGVCYSPQFKLVLTDEKAIKWVAEKLQRTYTHVKGNPLKNHKDTYCLRISASDEISDFIVQVLPYMIVKKEVATAMYDYCKSRQTHSKSNYLRPYTEAEIELHGKIRKLNRVGIEGREIL